MVEDRHRVESWLGRPVFLSATRALLLLVGAMIVYLAAFIWLTSLRYGAYQSSIDLGSQTHVLYGMTRGWDPPWQELLNYFALFAYTASGLLAVFPSPETLLVYQTILIDLGAIPVFFLAFRAFNRSWVSLLIAVSYLLSPLTEALNWFDIHFEFCATVFILAFIYFHTGGMRKLAIPTLVVALSFSDLIALGIAAWCAADVFADIWNARNPRLSVRSIVSVLSRPYRFLVLSLSLAWAATSFLLTSYLEAVLEPTGISNYVARIWPGVGSAFRDVLLAPFIHPSAFIANLTYEGDLKIWFLMVVFGAFIFFPLLDIRALAAVAPWLFLVLSSHNSPWYSVLYYQYGALLLPYLYYGFINQGAQIKRRLRFDYIPVGLAALVVVPMALLPLSGWNLIPGEYPVLLVPPVIAILVLTRTDLGKILDSLIPYETRPAATSMSPRRSAAGRWARRGKPPSSIQPGLLVWLCFGVVVLLLFVLYSPLGPLNHLATAYVVPTVTPRDAVASQIIATIPSEASVLAQDHLYPHLWNYRRATLEPALNTFYDYIFADVGDNGISLWHGQPWDYYTPIAPPIPSLSTMVMQNISLGLYGVSAEADGFLLLERNYSGLPRIYSPYNGTVTVCSLDYFATSDETCNDGRLEQVSNPSGDGTLWYGPYVTLPPGNFSAFFDVQANRSVATDVLTLAVTSYLPSQSPQLQTLNETAINSTLMARPNGEMIEVNFTVLYPTYIQFVAEYEVAHVLITLDSLSWIQRA